MRYYIGNIIHGKSEYYQGTKIAVPKAQLSVPIRAATKIEAEKKLQSFVEMIGYFQPMTYVTEEI